MDTNAEPSEFSSNVKTHTIPNKKKNMDTKKKKNMDTKKMMKL